MQNPKFISFSERATPLYPTYRPMYRVSQILLILYYNGFGGKASLLKLHLFSWGLRDKKNMRTLKSFFDSPTTNTLRFFGIESTLNRALNLACAEKLIAFDDGSYRLLGKGRAFAKELDNDMEIFIDEKLLLKHIGKGISEKTISGLVKSWSNV